MNVLIVGSGGREHALAWKINQSENCGKLYVAPGNAGTATIAENISIGVNDFEEISEFVIQHEIDLIVIGPEAPLVKGLRDFLEAKSEHTKLGIIGPGANGAQLEGSKDFCKNFLLRHNIPTAQARTFSAEQLNEGIKYLKTRRLPVVLKADGLAAGKGVIIAPTHEHATSSLKEMLLDKKFGEASSRVLIEDFLDGIELSIFVLTDGKDYVMLPEAKDYKRIGDGDTGPNTGGMGAVSPVPFADDAFMAKVVQRIIKPTIRGFQIDQIPYIGFVFIGLMNVGGDPYVIEYNVRMGDPETQVVLPRIKSDFLNLLIAAGKGQLASEPIEFIPNTASTVVLASEGYPESYEKGKTIDGLNNEHSSIVFHAGTKENHEQVVTNGGRVLAITGMADSLEDALSLAYQTVNSISWEGMQFRKDIGKDILSITR